MALASRGQRDMDSGPEAIADPGERARLRHQARVVHGLALVAATLLTVLALLV